jgi:hypothetical protein
MQYATDLAHAALAVWPLIALTALACLIYARQGVILARQGRRDAMRRHPSHPDRQARVTCYATPTQVTGISDAQLLRLVRARDGRRRG